MLALRYSQSGYRVVTVDEVIRSQLGAVHVGSARSSLHMYSKRFDSNTSPTLGGLSVSLANFEIHCSSDSDSHNRVGSCSIIRDDDDDDKKRSDGFSFMFEVDITCQLRPLNSTVPISWATATAGAMRGGRASAARNTPAKELHTPGASCTHAPWQHGSCAVLPLRSTRPNFPTHQ
jgi:hypothetical protein